MRGRSQARLAERGDARGTRIVAIRGANGTNLLPASVLLEGIFPPGSAVSVTVDTDITSPTVYRYPTGSGNTTVALNAAQMAAGLAAVIDAAAALVASARGGVVSILGAGGAVVVTLTSPAVVLVDMSPPSIPGAITVGSLTATTAAFSWVAATDALSGIASYQIQLAPDVAGVPGTFADATPPTVNSPTVTTTCTGLVTASKYWPRVRALNNRGVYGPWRTHTTFFTTA